MWASFGLSLAALGGCVVIEGMNRAEPKRMDFDLEARFSPTVLSARETLRSQLLRRFTDKQDVDFGMSRVLRLGQRVHFGSTMGIRKLGSSKDRRRLADGTNEYRVGGQWIREFDLKPMMSPENDSERQAIETLNAAKVDVAIYTVGEFESVHIPPVQIYKHLDYDDVSWGGYGTYRAHGPAYICQKSTTGPKTAEVVDFARLAWESGKDRFSSQAKGNWTLIAYKVPAPDMFCAKCHGDRNERSIDGAIRKVRGAVQKPGDSVGLFVLAMRDSKVPPPHLD